MGIATRPSPVAGPNSIVTAGSGARLDGSITARTTATILDLDLCGYRETQIRSHQHLPGGRFLSLQCETCRLSAWRLCVTVNELVD
jgi:hypothetical protein